MSSKLQTEERAVKDLIPYWRNPRKISSEAVNAVAQSISEYGYQQPIVVDENNVIIIGHTRWQALKKLKIEKIDVIVANDLTPKQVKELRVIDNKTSEFTEWDIDKLADELERLGNDSVYQMFPELDVNVDHNFEEIAKDVEVFEREAEKANKPVGNLNTELVCPQCFHSWERVITAEDIRSGVVESE